MGLILSYVIEDGQIKRGLELFKIRLGSFELDIILLVRHDYYLLFGMNNEIDLFTESK